MLAVTARPGALGARPHRHTRTMTPSCTFCRIVAGTEPATVVYEDDEVLVFRNRLRWLPTMLLVVPKQHRTQEELWRDLGAVGRVAVQMGTLHCPHGFRLVSNFGWDALQSQPHAHVHVLGGAAMDPVVPVVRLWRPLVERDGLRVSLAEGREWPPVVMLGEMVPERPPQALWEDMGEMGVELVRLGLRTCPGGFRLLSNFGWDALQAHPAAHVYLLGGDELGHYV
jgi:histidine triad (HIT) family protein